MPLSTNRLKAHMRMGLLTIPAVLLLSGCGNLSWFSGEEDPRPPTKLKDLKPEITVTILWSREIGVGTDERRLNLIPALHGGRLYVADAAGRILALDAATGEVLWEQKTDLAFSSGPGVDAKHIILGSSDGSLVARSAHDGVECWHARLDSEILSVPRIAGSSVVVHTLDDSVYALKLGTGDQIWKYSYLAPVLTLRGSSMPTVTDDSVIVGISDGRLVNLDLQGGVPRWETTVTLPHGRSELARIADIDADPILVGDTIYVATYNGNLAAVDLTTGSVHWRRQLSTHAGLAASADMLYITDSDDLVWATTSAKGTDIWQQEALKYRRLTAPAVFGNLVVVGDMEGYVHWLDRRDGRLVAQIKVADGPITGRPQVAGSRLYVYGNDGTLTALSAGPHPHHHLNLSRLRTLAAPTPASRAADADAKVTWDQNNSS